MRLLIIAIYIFASIMIAYTVIFPTNNVSKLGAIISLIGITAAACL